MNNLPEVSEHRKQEIENFINKLNLFEAYHLICNMAERIVIPTLRSTDDLTEFILTEESPVKVAIKEDRIHLITATCIEDLTAINCEIATKEEEGKKMFVPPLAKC
jgi:hypothetical protein